jgi:LytR cell envelope-related transcriptional attenuator
VPTTKGRRAKRSWGRRGRRGELSFDSQEIPVRWHSTDALPGGRTQTEAGDREDSSGPVRIRGAQAAADASAGPRSPDAHVSPPPPPPPRTRGRHRVRKKVWAPARRSSARGSRREAVRQRRRDGRRAFVRRARPFVAGAVAVALAAGAWSYLRSDDDGSARSTGSAVGLPTVTTTALIAGTETRGGEAEWLAVLSYDPGEDRAAIVYVPAHTAVEVPGRGLQGIGGAMTGGLDLLEVSSRNLFPGLHFTHAAELTRTGAVELFEDAGELAVDVPTEVKVGSEDDASLLFSAGLQELAPESIADLLYTKGFDDDDVDLGARQLAVWDSLFDTYRATPGTLSAAVERAGARAGFNRDTAAGLGTLFGRIATLPSDRLTLTVLPVEQVGVGGSELYDTNEEELQGFVAETVSGSFATDQSTVQVLNGVGTPGLGERVAKALGGEDYRVTLTGNVPGFGAEKTLVVTYDASPEGIGAAERARELLGVGEVQISGQGRVSVDMTIVVGKDFLKR